MITQRLSIGFAIYGLILLAAAAFCFWANSWSNAGWLLVAGLGIMTWSHFFNRKQYWGFRALMAQLFLMVGIIGWQVLTSFLAKESLFQGELTVTGINFFSLLFLISVGLLLLASKKATQIKEELH